MKGAIVSLNTTQYHDPKQLSISCLGNPMIANQNRYDNNVQQV
ncbi:hypothetical protein [Chryseobacterium arachidis]|nr:hypothetical protein [Chryseobacterium arachidis]